MNDRKELELRFCEQLGLTRRPVAVSFLPEEPTQLPRFSGSEPSGCSFWRLAAEGRTFYTVPADHYNCAVGSYTHNVELPPERARELDETLGLMTSVGYLSLDEIPRIPRLPRPPAAVLYSPLADAPMAPQVVLFACRPAAAMLLSEAAARAGANSSLPALGRPTCMALPAALSAAGAVTSLGCIGNRVYTGLSEDELYVVIPGPALPGVAEALETIVSANRNLAAYAENRRRALASE